MSESRTVESACGFRLLRVTILQTPVGIVDGVRLDQYQCGHTYELPSDLAIVLVLEGFARIERRLGDRTDHDPEPE